MLTRKHFETVAKILADNRNLTSQKTLPRGLNAQDVCEYAVNSIVENLCDYFQDENPNFNPEKFREATGMVRD